MQDAIDQDIDQLIQFTIGFATSMLEKHGEFYPVGAYLDMMRQLLPVGVHEGDDFPDSNDLIGSYEKMFGAESMNGHLLAWVIAFDATVQRGEEAAPTDAIIVNSFHTRREEQPRYVFPYKIENGTVEIDEDWWAESAR
jgi:hypothetical protein